MYFIDWQKDCYDVSTCFSISQLSDTGMVSYDERKTISILYVSMILFLYIEIVSPFIAV